MTRQTNRSPYAGCSAVCDCAANRREFLTLVGAGAAMAMLNGLPVMAGPFQRADFEKLVPADKKLSPEWVQSLFARGARTVYRGAELDKIGMPVGGICAGQVYLGGDGKLWCWEIFNKVVGTGAGHYAQPPAPTSPVDQGFSLKITAGGKTQERKLDRTGFAKISFCGEYPIGYVDYADDAAPVSASLEAFSPFIPLNVDDSTLPATVMRWTVKNTSQEPVEVELSGWLENAVGLHSAKFFEGQRIAEPYESAAMRAVNFSAKAAAQPKEKERPPIVFADFEGQNYGAWKVEGKAFGTQPSHGATNIQQHLKGFLGKGLVNTWPGSDGPKGKLTSPEFTIERPWISFLIGGGNHPGKTCINLVVDGKVVRTSTGHDTDAMQWDSWKVNDLAGKMARIEIVDDDSGPWGHIDIDQIEFRDRPHGPNGKLEEQGDFGTMTLAILQPEAGDRTDLLDDGMTPPSPPLPHRYADRGMLHDSYVAVDSLRVKLSGQLTRKWTLAPGQSATAAYVLAWHFPNLKLNSKLPERRLYGKRFRNSGEVAEYLAANFERLARETRLWHDTWYDSTLPYWFLDRTMANTSILASSTCYQFGNGRFYGFEGVGCCEGTCAHVWHYAHAAGRLFPPLERSCREMVDFGVAQDPDTGAIGFRGEFHKKPAIDGQAGCILRAYREHQMSADGAFLRRVWPGVKKAVQFLITQDGDGDGILAGAQHNTLDADWFGPVAWLSGLYLAALRAGAEMAQELGDAAFAATCRQIADRGREEIVKQLFDEEYFINRPDPKHPEAINSGTGCEIDQVFGQSWAFQVGLERVLPKKETLTALRALWRYNFTPDVGPYRAANRPGRWYAMPGEAGLLMCTFPRSDWSFEQSKGAGHAMTFAGYFNECMNGFEHQVAGHMIWEGMLQEGLAIIRAVHDRYHAARRNPWNEVECGDHYARSMASYGVFLAACGYEYHGPRGRLAFDPRLTPGDFRAPFTTAEGWGTFHQQQAGGSQSAKIDLRWGKLRVRTVTLTLPENVHPTQLSVQSGGKAVAATHRVAEGKITIQLAAETTIAAGDALEINVG